MAQYPIKMLKDENGTPFVPLVAPEAVKDNQGTDWQALIDKKLEKTNIIAGDNITLSVSGNDITINSQADYTALSNKPSLDTTSDVSLNPLKEEINGEISLHKIAKTGNYEDLLYKPIIPITFTDNMESDYSISKLPGWQVDLLQKMIDEYVKDNKSINNYILKADGIMFLENYAIGNLDNKYSTEGKNTRLYTFKKCGPYGSIPHAFQFVGPTSLSYTKYPEWGYGVIGISNEGILIYCDNNYRVTEVCQRYGLYDEAEKNTNVSINVVPTNLSSATAFIATKDHQPATKKYVDDSVGGIHIPTKTSQLQNDSDFVIKTTNELTNYYTKNNTYTKNEVDALVAGGSGTSDYSDLTNKPKINNVELSGNKSLSDLGITNFSGDYNDLSNKPSLDTTSGVSLNPLKEEINGEISLHKIAKTGNYEDLLYKPIIPITFTNNTKTDYAASELPQWQIRLLQQMINEYRLDNNSINNYILKVDGIMDGEDTSSDSSTHKYSSKGKNNRLYTFKKSGPIGNIPHAFQFVGPTSLSYDDNPNYDSW